MAYKKKEKKVIVKKEKVKESAPIDRKIYLRDSFIEHLKEEYPDTERKFNMYHVVELRGTRGSFRNYMEGDFKPEDRRILREIFQDLKNEKILLHVGACWWARLQ